MAERVHLHQWSHARRVTKVVGINAFCERRARRRLDCSDDGIDPALHLLPDEGKREAPKVGSAPCAADDHIRRLSHLLQLLQALLPNDGLVKENVVQNTSQAIFGVRSRCSDFDGLRDCDPQASRA